MSKRSSLCKVSSGSALWRSKPSFFKGSGMLACCLMELQPPAQTDCLLLYLDKHTCFYALVLTSLKISRWSALPSYCDWKQNDFSNSEAVKDIPLKIRIAVSLFRQIGTIGPHTSLGKSRTYLGNTNMLCRAFYTCLGNLGALVCSAAPITNCLVVLINHELWALHGLYFTLPPSSAPLWQSLCILLSSLHLAYLCFSACQLFQCKGVIEAWNMSTATFQEQFFQRSADDE